MMVRDGRFETGKNLKESVNSADKVCQDFFIFRFPVKSNRSFKILGSMVAKVIKGRARPEKFRDGIGAGQIADQPAFFV